MNEAIPLLQQLGFGDYEARAYMALLQHGPVNGYELAKRSGIPRPNIYPLLQKLEARGVVMRLDSSDATLYAAIPPEELLRRLDETFQDTLKAARQELAEVASPVEYAAVWNARGYGVLLDQARALMNGAVGELLVALWPQEALALGRDMAEAEARGVMITTLCLAACAEECGGCRGRIYRYRVIGEQGARWLVAVPDGCQILGGEIMPGGEAQVVRTTQQLLVALATWFIRHSIAMAAVVNGLGEQLDGHLSPESQAILANVGPEETSRDWLKHMRQLLQSGPAVTET